MKFSIPKNGKSIIHKSEFMTFEEGEFDTNDKELQEKLLKCLGVKEVKATKAKKD